MFIKKIIIVACVLCVVGCVPKKAIDGATGKNTIHLKDGFKAQLDSSFEFVGDGKYIFPSSFMGRYMDLHGNAQVYAYTAPDSKEVKESISINLLGSIGSHFRFTTGGGETCKLGAFSYKVGLTRDYHSSQLVRDISAICLDNGLIMSDGTYYVLTYTRHFTRSIRRITYLIEAEEVPVPASDYEGVEKYLLARFDNIFQVL